MGFEIYTRSGNYNLATNPDPVVSFRKSGSIAFSRGAQQLLAIDQNDGLVLLFDSRTGQVGIRVWESRDPKQARMGITCGSSREGMPTLVSNATGFLRRFRIDPEKASGIHPLVPDELLGLGIVQLPNFAWRQIADVTPIRQRLHAAREKSRRAAS